MSRLLVIVIFVLSTAFRPVLSEDAVVSDLQSQINQYTQKLLELSKAKDTLANQIQYLNSQISLTLLKISQTEASIKSLESDIADLTVKIDNLDVYLNQLSSAYIDQVNQNYRLKKHLPPFIFFMFNNFNSFFEQYKYLAVIQKNSQEMLVNMETVRTNYDLQKEQKKKKQEELEILKTKLADQKTSLAGQKDSKTNLLAITKNDELRYQQLKKAAEDELNSLLKAKFVGKRNVKKGEALGLMGNTGYSFGDHLHFGLYDLQENDLNSWSYTNDIDSVQYIRDHEWPMNDPIQITQERGHTRYSYLYADKFHHGIDMVSTNKTVKAVNDGVAYFFRNTESSLGNHVKLFHPDGKMTLYLHLQ